MINSREKGFNWNTYINDKAIVDFEKENGLSHVRIGVDGYYLLSFFVDLYINPKKEKNIKREYINECKYIYVSSSFILNNLLLLKITKRTLIRIIEKLERHDYIQKVVLNSSKRFIKINRELLKYYGPKNRIFQRPEYLKELAQEVGNYFSKTSEYQLDPVYEFLLGLKDLDYFKEQFVEFKNFKANSNEINPRFENFCKTWDDLDWKVRNEDQKHKDLVDQYKNH